MSNEKREPGCYWVKRDAASQWEIVQVHPANDFGQSVDAMGWDAGACLPADAEWGPRVMPPGEHIRNDRPTAARADREAVRAAIRDASPIYVVTEERISILEDGREVACIWREKPAWPEVGGPELTMWADGPADCRHGVLGCKMDGDPRESIPRPLIVCAGCGTEWRPSGL